MRVLITGANGFIGKALCDLLIRHKYEVYGAVRREAVNLYDEADTGRGKPHNIINVGEIGPDTDWSDALREIDIVIHLAARVHIMQDDSADPLAEFRKVNTAGTERLAQEAAKAGVRRFVYLSSIKVNGEGRGHGYSEEDIPVPQDPYAVSKWEAEQALMRILKETGLKCVIIRPPLVYGPGVRGNFLSLLKIVDHGIPLPLASVKNFRSQIFLENLTDAILLCSTHAKAVGQTFLVSDGYENSTSELIRLIADSLDKKAKLLPLPVFLLRCAGILTGKSSSVNRLLSSLTVNITKMQSELGWNPPYTMEQGLKETALWYKKLFCNKRAIDCGII